ncbi:MAG: hypothetical protein JWM71_1664, partial [Solirubrobacteraceae bacterium]|nr:hypothetical protein [Solirubrobacteraceae bacterium]
VEVQAPDSTHPYEVALDGECAWPLANWDFPPSVIRTIGTDRERLRICFGSCRCAVPHVPPWTLTKDEDARGREVDALHALALRMRHREPADWPDLLLMIGDQVYADEDAPRTREFIRSRRDVSQPPGEHVEDFEEYAHLYHETWGEPTLRWLLSTVPTAMLFDDHDVHDDWNTSQSWVREMRAKPWWEPHIAAALASYWAYQHLGNMSPEALERSGILRRVRAAQDGGDVLHEWALHADDECDGSRWSFCRDVGRTRLVMLDSREGRELEPADRRMTDDDEWDWIERHARGDVDHLLLADTLPVFFTPLFHHAEALSEAVCAGAWGSALARLGEKLRRAVDLEHWAAFNRSFREMCGLVAAVSAGERGAAPASVLLLGGDVHHAYVARVQAGGDSAVWQAVCSPFRNPLSKKERRQAGLGMSRPLAGIVARLAAAAGVPDPPLEWDIEGGPFFDNQVATVEIDGRDAALRIERTTDGGWRRPTLTTSLERRLT